MTRFPSPYGRVNTKPVRRAAPPVRRYAAEIFVKLAKKTSYVDPALAGRWGEIAGAETAALCAPGRITGGKGGKTLEVFAPNGAAAAKVQFEAEALREKVNRYFGPETIARIAVRQTGSTAGEAGRSGKSGEKAKIDSPKDAAASAGLDGALSRFRASVSSKKPDNS